MNHRLGICSWSLHPPSPQTLCERVLATGLAAIQLALDPLRTSAWDLEETADLLAGHDIEIMSGMMTMKGEDYTSLESIRRTGGLRPREHWPANLERTRESARIARRLDLELVTFHAGFFPEDGADPERSWMVERLREVVDVFSADGIRTALETGQETASTLSEVLEELDRPAVGVNFDPANLVLYDMGEPVEALALLGPWVRQCHIKDAVRSESRGQWGREVAVGQGAVDWQGFGAQLNRLERPVDLVIEREAGERNVTDIVTARAVLERVLDP